MQSRRLTWKATLDVAVSLAMLAAASTVVWFQFNPRSSSAAALTLTAPAKPLSISGAILKGSSQADAVLIIYSDFECSFCRRFAHDVLPQLESDYLKNGKVQVAFRHFPLSIHKQAVGAAVAAECAGRQGRFWEMHDLMFAASDLGDAAFASMASALKLDAADFNTCVNDETIAKKIENDRHLGSTLGIKATPAFLLGRRLPDGTIKITKTISGVKPLDDFRAALDLVLQ